MYIDSANNAPRKREKECWNAQRVNQNLYFSVCVCARVYVSQSLVASSNSAGIPPPRVLRHPLELVPSVLPLLL